MSVSRHGECSITMSPIESDRASAPWSWWCSDEWLSLRTRCRFSIEAAASDFSANPCSHDSVPSTSRSVDRMKLVSRICTSSGGTPSGAGGSARGGKKAAARATRMDAGDSARAVEIAGTQERENGETRWTAYQVRVRRGHAIESEVERRYSHFRVLREGLMDDVLSAAGESKAVAKGAAKLGSLFGGSVQSFLEGHFADEGLPALPSAMVFGQQRRSQRSLPSGGASSRDFFLPAGRTRGGGFSHAFVPSWA